MKLKDFATINMGQSPKGETYNTDGNGMPFLQGRKTFGRIYPTIDTWTTNPIKIANKDEILMSVRAPVGDMNFANKEICIGRGLCSISAKNGKNKYLYYMLLNSMNDLKRKSTGTVFDSINRKDLENLEINLHSEEEQEKIENILGSLDDKIELNNEINNNLYELAMSHFNSLYKEENNTYEVQFGDIVSLLRDGTHNPPKRVELGIPLLTGQTIVNGFIDYEKMTYVSEEDYKKIHAKYEPIENDLVLTKIGTVGKVGMLRKKDIPMCIHCNSALIRFDEEYMDQYTGFWFLNSDNFQSAFRKIVTNTVQDFVSLGSMQKLNVRVLKKDIMKDNYLIFKSIFEKISFNNNESTTLANLRDTLLPKLMNGEIDLDSVEI